MKKHLSDIPCRSDMQGRLLEVCPHGKGKHGESRDLSGITVNLTDFLFSQKRGNEIKTGPEACGVTYP